MNLFMFVCQTAWEFTDCQAIIDTTDEEIEKNPILDGEHSGGEANVLLNTFIT